MKNRFSRPKILTQSQLQNGHISASFNLFGPGPGGIDSAPKTGPDVVGRRPIPRGWVSKNANHRNVLFVKMV